MTSARPLETAFSVEYRWNTRTGSSELSTVTDDPSLILLVLAAIAASGDVSRRQRHVVGVVLADPEEVDPGPLGEAPPPRPRP